jgi:hypothetical protein
MGCCGITPTMNKELIEKIDSLRKELLAFTANVRDVEKLVDLIKRDSCFDAGSSLYRQSYEVRLGPMWRDYQELLPYMTGAQRTTAYNGIGAFRSRAQHYHLSSPEKREDWKTNLVEFVWHYVPEMRNDLDSLEATLRWLGGIADHMGCPLSDLLRYRPGQPWYYQIKTAAQSEEDLRLNLNLNPNESVDSLRKDLRAFQAQGTEDLKKLADLVREKAPAMERNYEVLFPDMTADQTDRAHCDLVALHTLAQLYPEKSEDKDFTEALTEVMTRQVPLLLADLDDIAKHLEQ